MSDNLKHNAPKLQRMAFTTSRLAEFCAAKELTAQTGHVPNEWPLVVAREFLDDSLDACEEAEIAPQITIEVNTKRCEIIIADNGPGLPRGCARLHRPGLEPRGVCVTLSRPTGQRAEVHDRNAVRAGRHARHHSHRIRRAGAPDRFRHGPGASRTQDSAGDRILRCTKRHPHDRALAANGMPSARSREGSICTDGLRLHHL